MKLSALLLFALLGWAAVGAAGILLSLARGRRAEAVRHSAWIGALLAAYLIVLLTVSAFQPKRSVPIGQDQCFGNLCFAVVSVDQVPGLVRGDTSRVIRVGIRVANRAPSAESDSAIRVYLVDSSSRVWEPLPGLSGNRLNARVAGGSQMLSQPMFRVADDAASLGLVFTHGNWQFGRLVIAASDSLGHKRTIVPLEDPIMRLENPIIPLENPAIPRER